jgi:hypothetical protein
MLTETHHGYVKNYKETHIKREKTSESFEDFDSKESSSGITMSRGSSDGTDLDSTIHQVQASVACSKANQYARFSRMNSMTGLLTFDSEEEECQKAQ